MDAAPPESYLSESLPTIWRRISRAQRIALGAAFLGGIALLVPGLVAPLWIDDVLRTFSTHVAPEKWWSWVLADVHNPLYNVFMRAWIHLFGDSLVSIRLPTALAALLVAACGSLWAAHRFGGWVGACFCAILLANPAFILHATMAKNNMFTVLFGLLAIICCDLARDYGETARQRGRWLVLAIVASGLGVYTDFAILYVLLPLWLAVGVEAGFRRDWLSLRRLGIIVGIVGILAIPLLVLKVTHAGDFERIYLRHFSVQEVWFLLGNWMLWGNALLALPEDLRLIAGVGLVISGPLLVRGVVDLWKSKSGRPLVAVFALPIVATFFASAVIHARDPLGTSSIYQERNLLAILPIYLLILVVGGLSMRAKWLGRGLLALLIGLNLLAAILQWTVHRETQTSYWPRRDFGAMAREIESRVERMDPPVLVVSVPPLAPTRYYLRHRDDIEYSRRRWRRYPMRFVDIRSAANEAGADELLLLVIRDEADFSVRLDIIAQRWATEHLVYVGGLDLYSVRRRGPNLHRGNQNPGESPATGDPGEDGP